MKPYLKRVVKEKRELDAKIVKLIKFINSLAVEQEDVTYFTRNRLREQRDLMLKYSDVLTERLIAEDNS